MKIQNKQILHIACAVDDSFAFPLSVLLVSIFENNRHNQIKIHLFSASLSDDCIFKLYNIAISYNQQFQFYILNKNAFEGLFVSYRMSEAAYYRILIPHHIDSNVERFLYLDSDIVIVGDLMPLFTLDLDENIIAAVNDIAAIDQNIHRRHNISNEFLYFNSGVLLVDKHKWISYNTTDKVLKYLKANFDICDNYDQDSINAILYNQRKVLLPIWNQQIGMYFIDKKLLRDVFNQNYLIALSNPIIIHFNGFEKPWHAVSAHPLRKQFIHYASLVNEFSFNDKIQFRKWVKKYLFYFVFGWARVNKYYFDKKKMQANGSASKA